MNHLTPLPKVWYNETADDSRVWNRTLLPTAISDPVERKRREAKSARRRLLVMVAGAVCIALAVVFLVIWTEEDRPLREVEAALKSGQNAEALKKVGLYLNQHPQDSRALILRARILVETRQLPEAIRIFQQVGPASVVDLHAWAKAHLLRQEWSAALPILQQLLQLSPDDADGLHEITACLSYLGQPAKAVVTAERMSKLKGHEARAFLQLGTLHENLQNKRLALEAWGHVFDYSPNAEGLQIPAADFLTAYGTLLLDDGRLAEALKILQQSLQRQETAEARLRLGMVFQQTDQVDKAIESWKRAVELSPDTREARESLAEVALANREYEQARKWLEPLLDKTELGSTTTYLMQRVCLALGDREASKQWQNRTAELHQSEHLRSVINRVIAESPDSTWSRAIRAHRFAETGNWREAEIMMGALMDKPAEEPFLQELASAIRNRSSLPSLQLIPIHQFQ